MVSFPGFSSLPLIFCPFRSPSLCFCHLSRVQRSGQCGFRLPDRGIAHLQPRCAIRGSGDGSRLIDCMCSKIWERRKTGVLARHLAAHRRSQAEKSSATPLAEVPSQQPPKLSPKEAELSQAKREERLAQYQHVVALRNQGFSQTAMADHIGIGHATVSRWLECGVFPEQHPRPRRTHLDPHLPLLRQRWEAGCHTIAQVYRELVARGYTRSYRSVYKQLVRLLPEGRKNPEGPSLFPRPPLLARQAVFLFLRRPEKLTVAEQDTLLLQPSVP
jgi:hypothetical protein